jgi:hypothetical protein
VGVAARSLCGIREGGGGILETRGLVAMMLDGRETEAMTRTRGAPFLAMCADACNKNEKCEPSWIPNTFVGHILLVKGAD